MAFSYFPIPKCCKRSNSQPGGLTSSLWSGGSGEVTNFRAKVMPLPVMAKRARFWPPHAQVTRSPASQIPFSQTSRHPPALQGARPVYFQSWNKRAKSCSMHLKTAVPPRRSSSQGQLKSGVGSKKMLCELQLPCWSVVPMTGLMSIAWDWTKNPGTVSWPRAPSRSEFWMQRGLVQSSWGSIL